MSDIVVYDAEHIISSHILNIEEKFSSQGQFYRGFISNINKQWFPLLTEDEINDFRNRYSEVVDKLFPKLPLR
jgi:hypothetical protein